MSKELLRLTITVAICFFVLAGAGIFSLSFWLTIFT